MRPTKEGALGNRLVESTYLCPSNYLHHFSFCSLYWKGRRRQRERGNVERKRVRWEEQRLAHQCVTASSTGHVDLVAAGSRVVERCGNRWT